MMSVLLERLGCHFFQLQLDRQGGLARRQAGAVGYAEDMRVDGDGRLSEGGIEDNVGGLPANPRQSFQCLPFARHLPTVPGDELLGHQDQVFGFGVEQANVLDLLADILLAERQHLCRSICELEQPPGYLVDADVGRLGGQGDGNQQRIWINPLELALWLGVKLGKAQVEFGDVRFLHDPPMTSRIE